MKNTFLKSEAGWSLPLTWILLIVIILLTYFFGWQVLLVGAGLFVLITLGVYIYNSLTALPDFNDACFWFVSNQSLDSIWQTLTPVLKAGEYEIEGENVWEWIESSSRNRHFIYNISRKHGDYSYPVILRVKCRPGYMKPGFQNILGQKLADALNAEVSYGRVNYLEGNNYAFEQEGTVQPGQKGEA